MDQKDVLRTNSNRIKEKVYMDRILKRLNNELGPFRDKADWDEEYFHAM